MGNLTPYHNVDFPRRSLVAVFIENMNNMTKKTYRVSLACFVPHNFECEVEAASELDAVDRGVGLFYGGMKGEIVKVSSGEIDLALSDREESEGGIPVGAYVQKIRNN
jgi:hypothetical protein